MFRLVSLTLFAGITAAVFLISFSPAYAVDTASPDPIADLRMESSTDSTVTLAWTAPGDDSMSGTVSQYDMRMSSATINPEAAHLAPIIGGEPQPVPGGETQRMTITNLTPSTTYWFIVKSQDRVGNVSPFSNVTSATTAFDTTPPEFQEIKIADLTPHSARVIWTSNEPSTSEVRYGTTADYGLYASSNSMVREHSLPLGGLIAATRYHYQLTSKDVFGNEDKTVNMTFETTTSTPASTTTLTAPILPSGGEKLKKVDAAPAPTVTFSPRTLNLKSRTKWVTAVVRLPKESREGMNFDLLRVNGTVKPALDFNRTKVQGVLTRYGTLWLKFSRAELQGLVKPDVREIRLALSGTTNAGPFEAVQTLVVENNITKAEWDRQQELKRKDFETKKQKRIGILEKAIQELAKRLEELKKQLEGVRNETYLP